MRTAPLALALALGYSDGPVVRLIQPAIRPATWMPGPNCCSRPGGPLWLERIEVAVEAFQGAWSAIHYTSASAVGPAHLRATLEEAVQGGPSSSAFNMKS